MKRFEGTRFETDTCPQRHFLRNEELHEVFTLRRLMKKKPGLRVLDDLTDAGVDALALIDAATAERMKEEASRG